MKFEAPAGDRRKPEGQSHRDRPFLPSGRGHKLAKLFLFAAMLAGREADAKGTVKPASVLNARLDHGRDRERAFAEQAGLARYETNQSLARAHENGVLVEMPVRGIGFFLNPALSKMDRNHQGARYVRPELRALVTHLGRRYFQKTGSAFRVNSLSRSCEVQAVMGGNAIACDESSHVAAAAADIRYRDMREKDRYFFEALLAEVEQGRDPFLTGRRIRIQATKEGIKSQCFHVAAFREPSKPTSKTILASRDPVKKMK